MSFLSIIVATSGRDNFYLTLLSVKDQMRPMDELLVWADGPQPTARKIFLNTIGNRSIGENPTARYYEEDIDPYRQAKGIRLVTISDAAVFVPGALDHIRIAAEMHPQSPLMFQAQTPRGIVDHSLAGFVPLNDKLGSLNQGQAEFIKETCDLQGELVPVAGVISVGIAQ